MDKFYRFIFYSVIFFLSTVTFYLLLVAFFYKIISYSTYGEEKIWEYFLQQNFQISHDSKNTIYLQNLLNKIPGELLPPKYPKIEILVVENEESNAFAAPGPKILITSGLIKKIKSENALIFVIGHEIGHLHRGDHLKEFTRNIIANLYSFINKSNIFGELLLLIDNNRGKQLEFLADKWALKILHGFYGHVGGYQEFFQLAYSENTQKKYNDNFKSHPEIDTRYKRITSLIEQNSLIINEIIIK